MQRHFEALALNSASLAEQKTLYDAAGIDRGTADAYERLLINLLMLDLAPAWLTNRLSRLVKSPRRYLVDPSPIGAALRLDVAAVMRDGDLLGRMLDTLVAAQLRPELALSRARSRLYHVREKNWPRPGVHGSSRALSGAGVIAGAVPVHDDHRFVSYYPGVVALGQRGDVAGAGVELGAVSHHDVQRSLHVILEMRCFAQVRARERLDVLRPAPAGLKGKPADFATADPYQVQGTALEGAGLVGRIQAFLLCLSGHDGSPSVGTVRDFAGAV